MTANGDDRSWRAASLSLVAIMCLVFAGLRVWYAHGLSVDVDEESSHRHLVELATGADRSTTLPMVALWPQQLLARGTAAVFGSDALLVDGERLSPTALFAARTVPTLYGVLALPVLFVITRRLHSSLAGVAAVLILGFSIGHIRASTSLLADALVALLTLLSVLLAHRSIDDPAPARFAALGAVLGVALAVKVTAALFVLPIVIGLAIAHRFRLRPMLLVASTALIALALASLLVPPTSQLRAALAEEQSRQIWQASQTLGSHFTVAVWGFLFPFRHEGHGLVLGLAYLLGATGTVFRCLFMRKPGHLRAHRLLMIGCPLLYLLGYAYVTPLFIESSFVPLLPFSAYFAATLSVDLSRALLGSVPGRRAVAVASIGLSAVLAASTGWRFVYHAKVPSTLEVALDWMRGRLVPFTGRDVFVEGHVPNTSVDARVRLGDGLAVHFLPTLSGDDEALSWADAFIFPRRRQKAAGVYSRLRDAAGEQTIVEGTFLRRRGPDLVATFQPYGPEADFRELYAGLEDGRYHSALEASKDAASVHSLLIWVSDPTDFELSAPRLWLDESELELAPVGHASTGTLFMTARLAGADVEREIVVEPPEWFWVFSPSGETVNRGQLSVGSYEWSR